MKATTAVQQWDLWREAGSEPRSRMAAFRIISDHTGIEIRKMKNAYSLDEHLDGSETLDSRLSFIVWDISENGGRLHDYDKDSALFQNLLTQASNFVYGYTRKVLNVKGHKITLPAYVSTGKGAKSLASMSPAQMSRLAASFLDEARNMVKRWTAVLQDPKVVGKTLRDLADEVESV